MIRIVTTTLEIDNKDGNMRMAVPRTPNPRIFAKTQNKNCLLEKPSFWNIVLLHSVF